MKKRILAIFICSVLLSAITEIVAAEKEGLMGMSTLGFNVLSPRASEVTVLFDDFDGTKLSPHWQLALKGATSGEVFADVADGKVKTGLRGGYDWWDSGGISTSYPISSEGTDTVLVRINKTGQTMSCWNYFFGRYVPCGFEFYLFSNPWAHWGYRAYLREPYNPDTGWPLDNYGFGILSHGDERGLQIVKGMGNGTVDILYNIPEDYWAANGVWEIRKEGSFFSLWYNGSLIGDVYDIPEISGKDLYFVADARRWSGWETVYVELDSVTIVATMPWATVCEVWTTDEAGTPTVKFDLGEKVYVHWNANGMINMTVYAPDGVTIEQEWTLPNVGIKSFVPSHGTGIYQVDCTGARTSPIAVGTLLVVPELPLLGSLLALIIMLSTLFIAKKIRNL